MRISVRHYLLLVASLFPISAFAQLNTWQRLDAFYEGDVRAFAFDTVGNMFAATDGGIYRRKTVASSWQYLDIGTNFFNTIYDIGVFPSGTVVTSTDYSMHRSTNRGETWSYIAGKGLRNFVRDSSGRMFAIAGQPRLAVTTNEGATWDSIPLPFSDGNISKLVMSKQKTLRCAVWGRRLYSSSDGAATWTLLQHPAQSVSDFIEGPSGDYFLADGNSIYRSTNSAQTWDTLRLHVQPYAAFTKLYAGNNGVLVAGTSWGVYQSTNNGETWGTLNLPELYIGTIADDKTGNIFGGALSQGVFLSTNKGRSWNKNNQGLTAGDVFSLTVTPVGTVLAGTRTGFYRSSDDGSTWSEIGEPRLYAYGPTAVGSVGNIIATSIGSPTGILRSTDDGRSWSFRSLSGSATAVLSAQANGTIVAGNYNGSVFRSTNDGDSWTQIRAPNDSGEVRSVTLLSNGFIYVAQRQSLYRSTTNGVSWIRLPDNNSVSALTSTARGELLASTSSGVMLVSNDLGDHWRYTNGPFQIKQFQAGRDGVLYALTWRGVFRSTDYGEQWQSVGGPTPALILLSAAVSPNGYVFGGSQNYGLYRVAEPRLVPVIPFAYSLRQNYPNPFNSLTTIEFSLTIATSVSLEVFDILGRKVASLIPRSTFVTEGQHSVKWDGEGMASGIYFYRLRIDLGGITETKKLILLR